MLPWAVTVEPKQVGVKRLLIVSDNHLGNKSTSTSMMINSLDETLTNREVMSTADAIIISGDLFDRLLSLPVTGVSDIASWFSRLLYLSKETGCVIRILEGTPSHDWKQSKLLFQLNEYYRIGADLKYFDELSIDEDESLGLTIGYVPDEWRETHEQTTREFKELMATRGYKQVDFIIMHGLFEFQIPKVKIPTFISSEWSKWAKYYIFIGHDHSHKNYLNIIVPGSHNRISMNEEHRKGYVCCDIIGDSASCTFIVNELAKRYDTLDLADIEDDAALVTIKERLNILRVDESKLRIRLSADSNLASTIQLLKKEYLTVEIKPEFAKRHVEVEVMEKMFKERNLAINIEPSNVCGMIERFVGEELDFGDIKYEVETILSDMGVS